MEDLFAIQSSNEHQSLLLSDPEEWRNLSTRLNRISLIDGWTPRSFGFQASSESVVKMPKICTAYVPGVIAFCATEKAALFPGEYEGLEFLPITVGVERWFLLNCLNAVVNFNESRSQVMRSADGEIFMVLSLYITDLGDRQCELFTLLRSNRMQIFARSSFKKRVESLGLRGISFRKIGDIA